MNEYIFYTTEGFTEAPNKDYPVENCQVLGTAFGNNHNEALETLLNDNKWITDAGFSTGSIIYRKLAPSD